MEGEREGKGSGFEISTLFVNELARTIILRADILGISLQYPAPAYIGLGKVQYRMSTYQLYCYSTVYIIPPGNNPSVSYQLVEIWESKPLKTWNRNPFSGGYRSVTRALEKQSAKRGEMINGL
jgi:hypothetical protein